MSGDRLLGRRDEIGTALQRTPPNDGEDTGDRWAEDVGEEVRIEGDQPLRGPLPGQRPVSHPAAFSAPRMASSPAVRMATCRRTSTSPAWTGSRSAVVVSAQARRVPLTAASASAPATTGRRRSANATQMKATTLCSGHHNSRSAPPSPVAPRSSPARITAQAAVTRTIGGRRRTVSTTQARPPTMANSNPIRAAASVRRRPTIAPIATLSRPNATRSERTARSRACVHPPGTAGVSGAVDRRDRTGATTPASSAAARLQR